MMDVVTIQLRFGVQTPLGLYQDTLSFTEDEWAKRDPATVDAAKQKLADEWVVFRSAQIADEVSMQTAQGVQDKIASLTVQIEDLTATRNSLAAMVIAAPAQIGG